VQSVKGEVKSGNLRLKPVKVIPFNARHKLDLASRLNYGKLYTVDYNAKVWFIGMLPPGSLQQVQVDFDRFYPGIKFAEGSPYFNPYGTDEQPQNSHPQALSTACQQVQTVQASAYEYDQTSSLPYTYQESYKDQAYPLYTSEPSSYPMSPGYGSPCRIDAASRYYLAKPSYAQGEPDDTESTDGTGQVVKKSDSSDRPHVPKSGQRFKQVTDEGTLHLDLQAH
jgi:hypothetical protein